MRTLMLALTTVALTCTASAHEFWISPAGFRLAAQTPTPIRLMVGDGFPGEPRPRDPTKLDRFVCLGAHGETPVPGVDGESPAGVMGAQPAGTYVLAYRSRATRIELEASKFEAYLKEEGLESIIEARKASGQASKPGRELFSRCAKAVVRVGDGPAEGFDRAAGLPVELTPLDDPFALKVGDTIRVRATRDGVAIPGATVHAFAAATPGKRLATQTADAQGVATFKVEHAGVLLFNTIWMSRAAPGADAEWESLWASLTVETGAGSAPKPAEVTPAAASPVPSAR